MQRSITIAFALGAVSVPFIAVGLASGVFASSSQPASEDNAPSVSSVRVDDTQELSEAQDAARIAPLAKISADAAAHAALQAQPGTVQSTTLENDGGNVVYSVIVASGGRQFDVKVDAGNAKVLRVDGEQQDAENGNDGNGTVTEKTASGATDARDAGEQENGGGSETED